MELKSNMTDLTTVKIQHVVEKEFNIKNGRQFRKEIKNLLIDFKLHIESVQLDYIESLKAKNEKFEQVKFLLKS